MPAPALLSGSKDDLCVMITSNFSSYWSAVFWDMNWWLQSATGSFGSRQSKKHAASYHCTRQTPVKRAVTTVCLLLCLESSAVVVPSYCDTLGTGRHTAESVIYADQKWKGKSSIVHWKKMALNHAGKCQVFPGYLWTIDSKGLNLQCWIFE